MTNLPNPDEGAQSDLFYARTIPRMLRIMLVLGVLSLGPVFWFYGWAGAIGGAAGSAVSYINFRTLIRGVETLGGRIVNRQSKERGCVSLLRFLVRDGLGGGGAYAVVHNAALRFRGV